MIGYEQVEYEFCSFLRHQRKAAEADLRRIFPALTDGVSVQGIEELVSECLYWKSIPDDWAERYSSYICEQYELEDMTYLEMLMILDIQEWIQNEVETAELLAAFRATDYACET